MAQNLTGGAAVLARIRAQRAASAPKTSEKPAAPPTVTVLFGSQTGTAREIARNISAEAVANGLKAEAKAFDEVRLQGLNKTSTPILVVVASSTGDGDAPDNALKTVADLKRAPDNGQLNGVRFTLLGLGDSNYTQYMHVPRTVKNRLLELGATEFYPCVEADEVAGLDDVADSWTEGLLPVLKKECSVGATTVQAARTATPATTPPAATATPTNATPAAAAPTSNAVAAAPSPAAAAPSAATAVAAASIATPAASVSVPVAASNAAPGVSNGTAAPVAAPLAASSAASVAASNGIADAATVIPSEVEGSDGWVSVPTEWELKGVPALVPCNVELQWEEDAGKAQQVQADERSMPLPAQLSHSSPSGDYTPNTPFWAPLSGARLLTKAESERRVLHLEFDIKGSNISFQPGDSVAVLPDNNADLVEGLLKRLNLDGDKVLAGKVPKGGAGGPAPLPHLQTPCTLRFAFTRCLDLTTPPKKSLLRLLGEHASDAAQRRQLLYLTCPAGREQYSKLVLEGQPSLLDLLNKFPSCLPPVEALLDALPPLTPRPYSLTNAPCCGEDALQVALSVVNVSTVYGPKLGVCSTWLDRLALPLIEGSANNESPKLAICMRKGGSFRAPSSLDQHWIMIGPGTGVAPFRGFLQERRHKLQAGESATGEAWLFFGCRRPDEDYLYQEELESFRDDGTLTSLQVAFSRVGEEKEYVQHLMKRHGEQLASMVREGAYVFVCGDGFKMAKDVHATLVALLGEEGEQLLLGMTRSGKYVRDIWS